MIPAGTFSPYTAIPTNIVLISRSKTADLFVGQLTPGTDPSPLLDNLRKRKMGASIELGRLVKLDEFTSWHKLVATEEEQRLAKRSGLQAIRLKDVVSEVNLGNPARTPSGLAFWL
jgi:hypothetical protein